MHLLLPSQARVPARLVNRATMEEEFMTSQQAWLEEEYLDGKDGAFYQHTRGRGCLMQKTAMWHV